MNSEDSRLALEAVSRAAEMVRESVWNIAAMYGRPSVLYRPSLAIDGNKWCALYGSNLMEGVAGFGDSPDEAMTDFDKRWRAKLADTHSGLAVFQPKPKEGE